MISSSGWLLTPLDCDLQWGGSVTMGHFGTVVPHFLNYLLKDVSSWMLSSFLNISSHRPSCGSSLLKAAILSRRATVFH